MGPLKLLSNEESGIKMDALKEYSKIQCDLSGATSKNRFRLEMLWGASKMFDLFEKDDFCVVFDYKCDIEIHFSDSFEFYQLKTHKVQRPYNFTKIAKQDKNGRSIFGKLYLLRNGLDSSISVKLAIVSNAFLKIGNKTYSDSEVLQFSDLDDNAKKAISESLSSELGNSIDLNDFEFIYTSMNLLNPENDLRGKIIGSFERVMSCEPEKPNALYRLIVDTIESKACYEMRSNEYEELKKNKGITKAELYSMLSKHATYVDTSIEKADKIIENYFSSPSKIRKYKVSLVTITKDYLTSVELKDREEQIVAYLYEHEKELPDNQTDTLDLLFGSFNSFFSVEYSEIDRKVFILLVLLRWEDGKYE